MGSNWRLPCFRTRFPMWRGRESHWRESASNCTKSPAGSANSRLQDLPIPTPDAGIDPGAGAFLIFQEQAARIENLPAVDWSHTLEKECLHVDIGGMARAASELLVNALAHLAPAIGLKVAASAGAGEM